MWPLKGINTGLHALTLFTDCILGVIKSCVGSLMFASSNTHFIPDWTSGKPTQGCSGRVIGWKLANLLGRVEGVTKMCWNKTGVKHLKSLKVASTEDNLPLLEKPSAPTKSFHLFCINYCSISSYNHILLLSRLPWISVRSTVLLFFPKHSTEKYKSRPRTKHISRPDMCFSRAFLLRWQRGQTGELFSSLHLRMG